MNRIAYLNYSSKPARRIGVLAGVIATLLCVSCSSDSDDEVVEPDKSLSCGTGRDTTPELGESFALPEGDVVQIADEQVFVQFLGVASDSRCPVESTCISAGDITIKLGFTADGNATDDLLISNVYGTTTNVEAQGYTVSLSDVTPHQRTGVTIAQGTHCATLSVSITPES